MLYMLLILILVFSSYFITILVISFGFYKSQKNSITDNQRDQKISIIIPVRNEEENITACLNSLNTQEYTLTNFEVIVVNDHSTDNTVALVQEFIIKSRISISLLNLTATTSKKEALKLGVENANYPIIASTDGDCFLPKKWLKNISNSLSENTKMLLGPVMFSDKIGFLNAFQLLDFSAVQGLTFGSAYYQLPVLNNAANLSYRKESLNLVGGYDNYDTPSGDDVFLLEKFISSKLKVNAVLKSNFIVKTPSEQTYVSFFNQRIRWASKAGFYTNKLLIFYSGIIFLTNILALSIYFLMFFIEDFRLVGINLLLSKWLIDFILLFLVTSFFEQRKKLVYFIPVQLVYPIYIVVIALFSKLYQFEWKGRKVNE